MLCHVQHSDPPRLILAQVLFGELFLVCGVPALARAVCSLTQLVDDNVAAMDPASLVREAGDYYQRVGTDRVLNVVVVACTVRQGDYGFLPTGVEFDLPRDAEVLVVRQAEPLQLKVPHPQPARQPAIVEGVIAGLKDLCDAAGLRVVAVTSDRYTPPSAAAN